MSSRANNGCNVTLLCGWGQPPLQQLRLFAQQLRETAALPVSESDKADYATHPCARFGDGNDTNNTQFNIVSNGGPERGSAAIGVIKNLESNAVFAEYRSVGA